MPLVMIESLDDPRLDMYRHLKKTNLTRWSGQFITEGKKLTIQLLQSDWPVHSALCSDRYVDELAPFVTDRVPVYVLPHAQAQLVVGFSFHCGMLGCGFRRPEPTLAELMARPGRHLLVACPKTENPDNIGAIIRISAGFGVTAVLLGKGCANPFSRRALRVSMGNALNIPILEAGDELQDQLLDLRRNYGASLLATVLDESAEPLRQVQCPGHCVLLLGNEDAGLAPEWIELSDRRITIPMRPGTDSLNVAVAAGIFLHHFAS